jgi:lipoprotein signal peptidase
MTMTVIFRLIHRHGGRQRSVPPREPVAPRAVASRVGLVALVVATTDLLTKAVALSVAGRSWVPGWIDPVENPALSLDVASASRSATVAIASVALIAFGAACTVAVVRGWFSATVPGLLVGGSMGNLVDRVGDGAVHDFLRTPWAIINLADVAVLAGVALYASAMVRRPRRHASGEPPAHLPAPTGPGLLRPAPPPPGGTA